MARILEGAHPLERDRAADVDVRRRDVDPELHAQRAGRAEASPRARLRAAGAPRSARAWRRRTALTVRRSYPPPRPAPGSAPAIRTDRAPRSRLRPRTTGRTRGSRHPSTGATATMPVAPRAPRRAPNPVVTIVIETAVKSARTRSAATASSGDGIAASSRTPTPALPPMPWTSADPERSGRRAHRVPVAARRPSRAREGAVAPADDEPHGEEDDERRNGGLGPTLERVREIAVGEEDRDAEHDERQRVTGAPPRTEARRRTRRALPARRHERRDGGDVIGIRGVPQSEQHRDDDHDGDRSSVGQPCDPVVEPEHRVTPLLAWTGVVRRRPRSVQTTPGIAFTVITRPTTTMTAAETAGSARITGPSSRARPNARRASTATRPIAVIVAARPTLNATISASPKASRWSAIALSRTTSADGQGSRPAAAPIPRIPRVSRPRTGGWW